MINHEAEKDRITKMLEDSGVLLDTGISAVVVKQIVSFALDNYTPKIQWSEYREKDEPAAGFKLDLKWVQAAVKVGSMIKTYRHPVYDGNKYSEEELMRLKRHLVSRLGFALALDMQDQVKL